MKKKLIILIFCFANFILLFSASVKKHGSDALILCNKEEDGKYNLWLFYIQANRSKIDKLMILKGISFWEIKQNGNIYFISDASGIVKENTKLVSYLGINLIRLPRLPNMINTLSPPHFTMDESRATVYYSYYTKKGNYLSSYNLRSKKQQIYIKKYQFLGFFALSPDREKLSFFSSQTNFRLGVDVLFLKNGKFKNIAPVSSVIFPYGPYRTSPVWSKDSKNVYFMALYNMKSKDIGVYCASINGGEVKFIGSGGWPSYYPLANELFYGAYINAENIPKATIINLNNSRQTILSSETPNPSLSCTKRYISYINPSDKPEDCHLMIYDTISKKKIVVTPECHFPPDYRWIRLGNSKDSQNKK